MASATEGEDEISWAEKCRGLSDRVVLLERKLLAMDNLQQLVREKEEESNRLKSVIHQYSWALQWSEHQLRGVAQNSTADDDDKSWNSEPKDAGYAKGIEKTKASMSIDEDPQGGHSLSNGALYGTCTPFGLDVLRMSNGQEQQSPLSPSSPTPDGDTRTNHSEPIFFMQKSPVSKDLVEKLMQQNARLKKALKVVLSSREATTNNSFELNRQKQQTEEHANEHTQKRMRLWDKTKSSKKKYSCLSLQTSCFNQNPLKDRMSDITEDAKDCKGNSVQLVPN